MNRIRTWKPFTESGPWGFRLNNVPMGQSLDGRIVTARIDLLWGELSVSWETRHSHERQPSSFGQIDDLEFTQGSVAHELHRIWKRWHLNHMRAGCEHQRALGWDRYKDHPSEPCPTCGYKYGTEWLREELPASVLEWLEWLKNEVEKAL